jgi:hypothetical protein
MGFLGFFGAGWGHFLYHFSNLGFEKGGFIGARAKTITLHFEFFFSFWGREDPNPKGSPFFFFCLGWKGGEKEEFI